MKKQILTDRRRKILVFWYQYHKRENLWPTLREASLMIDIPFGTIQYHIRVLIDAEWLKRINRQIGLTKEGEKALIEAELITLGKASREVNLTKNKFKKKSNG